MQSGRSGKGFRERMRRPRSRLTVVVVAACLVVGLLVALEPAAAITTTEPVVEATHTTLPVVLDEREQEDDEPAASIPAAADLTEAESKDPQRLEIIKQIRKVNQDGSYTVGYEAEDGTFKIESRDVLGNVKGTYGYIDANGDIKRVSYGGDGQARRPTTPAVAPVTEEDIDVVHIPPRFNRSQHQHQHQLLVPTTRRPPNYQPPTAQHLLHHNPHHASTLRPSVIQTIPRKRPGYAGGGGGATTPTTSTTGTTAATTTTTTTTPTSLSSMVTPVTQVTPVTMTTTSGVSSTNALMTAQPTTEMPLITARHGGPTPPSTPAAYGEQSTASSHTTPLLLHNTRPGLLIIRPTPLPYQTLKTAEQQLARPERLVAAVEPNPNKFAAHHPVPSKKPSIRGNFLRRQLPPATVENSGEQYETQQQQQAHQIVYGQSVSSADGGTELYGRPVYGTHPSPRIPAAVLAARQRAAHIQSVLQSQGTTERVYAKQPVRPSATPAPVPSTTHRHHGGPAPIVYEPSTEPSSENAYVTDSPAGPSVVQIPAASGRGLAAGASETEPDTEPERRPAIFRPRPTLEYRPREAATPGPRYRTPYGLPPPPPPFGRPFASQEHAFGRTAGDEIEEAAVIDGREPQDAAVLHHHQQYNGLAPYRQQRRLSLPAAAAADTIYNQQHQHQQQPQPQPQNAYPIPVPYGRLPPSPYYYDIPAERPLTARDFERILQVLIYRHQQLQVAQQQAALRYPGGGASAYPGPYHGVGYGAYNPYYPGPSAAPFGLAGSYGGYPQQQIPRPPLPFPYGSHGHPAPYDGGYLQNPLYSPSAPSPSAAASAVRGGPDEPSGGTGAGGFGGLQASRRQGQYYGSPSPSAPPLEIGASSGPAPGTGRSTNGDFLPPEVRESLLYRMLMLAIQAPPASGEVGLAGLAAGPSHLHHHLQGASSMPQPNVRTQTPKPDSASTVAAAAAAATMSPMYSKKPVRSVLILGEE